MVIRLVVHLFRRLMRPGRMLGLGALASVPGGVFLLAGLAEDLDESFGLYHEIISVLGGATLPIVALVIGVATLREERDAGTLPYLYLQPIPRWRFALSSIAAGAGAAVVLAAFGWTVSWVAAGLITGSWTHALPAASAYLGSAVGYAAVFVPLGYLVPRAVLVGLVYVFVWEGIVATLVNGLAQSSIWRISMSIYADLATLPRDALDVLGPVLPGAGGALVKLAGVVVVGWGLLTAALRYRDAL